MQPAAFLALAMQIVFPLFSQPNSYTVLSLQNHGETSHSYRTSVRSPTGQLLASENVTVPSNQEITVDVGHLVAHRTAGWISVEGATVDSTAYVIFGTGTAALASLEPARELASTIYFESVRMKTAGSDLEFTETDVAIVNPGANTTTITVSLASYDGMIRRSNAVPVAPQGSTIVRLSGLLPATEGADFHGNVVLRADREIAAWQIVRTARSWGAIQGKPAPLTALQDEWIAPFWAGGGGYISTVSIRNLDAAPASFEVEAYDLSGAPLGMVRRVQLDPGTALAEDVDRLLGIVLTPTYPSPVVTGSLRIRPTTTTPLRLLAQMETRFADGAGLENARMLYWLDARAFAEWETPLMAKHEAYYTAYVITPASALLQVQTNVTVEVYGLDGYLLYSTAHVLSPRSMIATILPRAAGPGTHVRFHANMPISVLEVVGTLDGQTFETIVPNPRSKQP